MDNMKITPGMQFIILGIIVALLCLMGLIAYPSVMRAYHNTDGIGRPIDVDDPRAYQAPICISNTHTGWSMYRGPNEYIYTVSQPGRRDTTARTPWLTHRELQSVDCVEYRP